MNEWVERLIQEFGDKEYAHGYMQQHTLDRIAAQLYHLRQQRGLSQEQLAQLAGVSQERVCKLETGDFDSLTLKTLWKFSEALDVHLQVTFTSFSAGIMSVVNLSAEKLKVTERNADLLTMQKQYRCELKKDEWHSVDDASFTITRHKQIANQQVLSNVTIGGDWITQKAMT
ncbi:helix-turn-helix domain-containing protein [Thiolinea disciformis]|uniref:helix-turn-helix domain-containing protein n=1 Tax=Thiolinea disciformis TaxID=125614 RepID=UPI0003707487|nr:helix-turn-helix domain-containing protein [Thiolinea disciformis]